MSLKNQLIDGSAPSIRQAQDRFDPSYTVANAVMLDGYSNG